MIEETNTLWSSQDDKLKIDMDSNSILASLCCPALVCLRRAKATQTCRRATANCMEREFLALYTLANGWSLGSRLICSSSESHKEHLKMSVFSLLQPRQNRCNQYNPRSMFKKISICLQIPSHHAPLCMKHKHTQHHKYAWNRIESIIDKRIRCFVQGCWRVCLQHESITTPTA